MYASLTTFKRVLITGSGGVLGTAILSALQQQSEDVELSCPPRSSLDLLDTAAVTAFFKTFQPDLVLHLAGKVFGVQGNLSFGGQSFYENTLMNLNVVEASRLAGARKVVAAGTTAIYSDLVALPMREEDLWIGAPHGSEGPYGHAKRSLLAHLESYKAQYGMDYAYLILTNLYGANDRFDEVYGHVVPSLISRFTRASQENQPEVVCWGNGSPTRDFLYSADAANAFIVAAEKGHSAINTATGKAISIRELVETIVRHTGYHGRVVWDESKPLGQMKRSYAIDKASALGWSPQYNIDKGIKETVDWFKANISSVRA